MLNLVVLLLLFVSTLKAEHEGRGRFIGYLNYHATEDCSDNTLTRVPLVEGDNHFPQPINDRGLGCIDHLRAFTHIVSLGEQDQVWEYEWPEGNILTSHLNGQSYEEEYDACYPSALESCYYSITRLPSADVYHNTQHDLPDTVVGFLTYWNNDVCSDAFTLRFVVPEDEDGVPESELDLCYFPLDEEESHCEAAALGVLQYARDDVECDSFSTEEWGECSLLEEGEVVDFGTCESSSYYNGCYWSYTQYADLHVTSSGCSEYIAHLSFVDDEDCQNNALATLPIASGLNTFPNSNEATCVETLGALSRPTSSQTTALSIVPHWLGVRVINLNRATAIYYEFDSCSTSALYEDCFYAFTVEAPFDSPFGAAETPSNVLGYFQYADVEEGDCSHPSFRIPVVDTGNGFELHLFYHSHNDEWTCEEQLTAHLGDSDSLDSTIFTDSSQCAYEILYFGEHFVEKFGRCYQSSIYPHCAYSFNPTNYEFNECVDTHSPPDDTFVEDEDEDGEGGRPVPAPAAIAMPSFLLALFSFVMTLY